MVWVGSERNAGGGEKGYPGGLSRGILFKRVD